QWRVWQRLTLERLRGADTLEVGCGIGTLLADMAQAGYQCQAIDRSPQMVAATRRELRRRGISPQVASVRQASVQALPFASASFDNAVSTFPTDYIADQEALREIRRVLRPDGRLIVVVSAMFLPGRALLAPLDGIQRLVYGRAATREASHGATVQIGDTLQQRMRVAGFEPRLERVRGPFWVAYVITATVATNR
ncbi:MAG TPA: class I SAM-dependent methyltransferase, partial [Ktedonobacterales bacterium]